MYYPLYSILIPKSHDRGEKKGLYFFWDMDFNIYRNPFFKGPEAQEKENNNI